MPLDARETERTVREFYRGLAGGDGDAVVAAMAEDVILELPRHRQNEIIPYMGTFRGQAGIAECGRLRDESTTTLHYEILDIVATEGRACVTTFTRAMQNRTRIEYEVEDIHHLTLNAQGKISRWKIYFDSIVEVVAFTADQGERLLAALWTGDDEAASAVLTEDGVPVDARDPDSGLTALMIAAGTGNAKMTRALLEAGADVFATDPKAGATALHKACQGGSLPAVKLLVEAGAAVNAPTSMTGHTPILEAIWFKQPEIVSYLLERGAGLNVTTLYGFTLADHVAYALKANAVDHDKIEAIAASIEARRKADTAQTENTPLIAAALAGDADAVRRLLAGGAPVDDRAPFLNGFNDCHTPLLIACREGHEEIVGLLIDAGADVNATEPTFGAVPLHKATYNGHAGITTRLCAAPGINLDFQGATNGYTPLHDALWHGYEDCARVLVEAGARLDLRGHDGKPPLRLAEEKFGAHAPLTSLIRQKEAI
jgi:uncharacterized protein